jgi:hypothetical protein
MTPIADWILSEDRDLTPGLSEMRGEKFDYAGRIKADEVWPKTCQSIVKDGTAAAVMNRAHACHEHNGMDSPVQSH